MRLVGLGSGPKCQEASDRLMKQIQANVGDLIAILESNKEKHVAEYNEAVLGYRQEWADQLEEKITELQDRVVEVRDTENPLDLKPYFNIGIRLPYPKSYESDYDRAIGMLNMHQEDTIGLDSNEYDQYVMDNWSWKDEISVTNTHYAAKNGPH